MERLNGFDGYFRRCFEVLWGQLPLIITVVAALTVLNSFVTSWLTEAVLGESAVQGISMNWDFEMILWGWAQSLWVAIANQMQIAILASAVASRLGGAQSWLKDAAVLVLRRAAPLELRREGDPTS